jgi:hypothetical protein
MDEKCEGEGDMRCECKVLPLPLEGSRDACGVFDLSRETVGCKKGRASFDGLPFLVGDPSLCGVTNPSEDVDGVWSESMSTC